MNIKKLLKRTAKLIVVAVYRTMNTVIPVKPERIVISSSLGKSYSGNPKALYEQLVKEQLDIKYECIWFYENHPFNIPGRHKQVKFGRLKYIFYMATAKFWIFDARQPEFLRKRNRVVYIQTWHGTPLKKLGLDMENVYMAGETDIEAYHNSFRKNAASWDYLISQNTFSSVTFRRAFDFKGTMLEYGYPRNDVLINNNNSGYIMKLRQELGLPEDRKIMLYAPTWRDDEANGIGRYRFSDAMEYGRMKDAFDGEAVMIVKYHYLIRDSIDWSEYDGFVYVFDQTVDIAQLYLVSDMLITDYSSVMFDYGILGRPMYFYCYDLDRYKNMLRGFYFDFENNSPGPISYTTEELINDIKNGIPDEYDERYKRFVERYNPWDDGNASHNVLVKLLGME